MSTRCQIEFYDADSSVTEAEPAARIYKHSDGYPDGILPMLKKLEKILAKNMPMYGPRTDDPEWAAAEFVVQYRVASSAPKDPNHEWKHIGENGDRTRGNIYVSQHLH